MDKSVGEVAVGIQINSDKLRIESISASMNLTNYIEMLEDPNVYNYIQGIDGTESFSINSIAKMIKNYDGYLLAVLLKKSGEHIGNIGVSNIDVKNDSCSIGIMFHSRFHGFGYAFESMRLVIDYVLNILKMHRIYLYVAEENKPAIKLYEKLGFVCEGTQRDGMKKYDTFYDMRSYSLLATDFC